MSVENEQSVQIARDRIAREAIERTGTLDLSGLDLLEFPAELIKLIHLRTIVCSESRIADLSPLSGLSGLQTLDCSDTPVADLSPLSGLPGLQTLDCSNTPVADLSPLSGLSGLQTLDCSNTSVADLSPLSGLSGLQRLDCSGSCVSDLEWLLEAKSLPKISVNDVRLRTFSQDIVLQSRVSRLYLYKASIHGVPREILSRYPWEDFLPRLHSYVEDALEGSDPVTDVTLFVIGNGRIGKTQICRRLLSEEYDESVESTHGITVKDAPLGGVVIMKQY